MINITLTFYVVSTQLSPEVFYLYSKYLSSHPPKCRQASQLTEYLVRKQLVESKFLNLILKNESINILTLSTVHGQQRTQSLVC